MGLGVEYGCCFLRAVFEGLEFEFLKMSNWTSRSNFKTTRVGAPPVQHLNTHIVAFPISPEARTTYLFLNLFILNFIYRVIKIKKHCITGGLKIRFKMSVP